MFKAYFKDYCKELSLKPLIISLAFITSINLSYGQIEPSIIFTDFGKTYGDTSFNLSAVSNSFGTISYSLSSGDLSSINLSGPNNQVVTIISTGSVILKASQIADGGFNSGEVTMTLTISQKALTATADDKAKIYGDANPTLTVSYSGFVNGDDENDLDTQPAPSTTATAASFVADYTITLAAGTDNNYAITEGNGTLTVNQKALTATADDKVKIYGDANPTLTVSYSGFVNGDDENDLDTQPAVSTTANLLSNVEVYDITISGGIDNNYNLVLINGELTVLKATVSVTADDKTREYGENNPLFTLTFTTSEFKNGENESVIDQNPNLSSLADNSSDVGSNQITLSGGEDGNYVFSFQTGTLTITQATLQAFADDKGKTYGESNPELSISYTGFKNSDNAEVLDTEPTIIVNATVSSFVGDYGIVLAGGTDNNYLFDLSNNTGKLTINKKDLTVTANEQTRVYGIENPTLTFSYDGFENGDSEDDLDIPKPSTHTNATVLSNVGDSAVFMTVNADNNYNLIPVDGTLSIAKATVTVVAEDKTKVYGGINPELTFQYTAGFKNGDDPSDITTDPAIVTEATPASDVDNYDIALSGGLDENYLFNLVNGNLEITKATLITTAEDKLKTYGGANPEFTVAHSGFQNDDTPAGLDSPPIASPDGVDETTDVGIYDIELTSNGLDNNYLFDIQSNNGKLTINKKDLTVAANEQVRIYGDENPTLTFSYDGFENGDSGDDLDIPKPFTHTNATVLSNVGDSTVFMTVNADNNYNLIPVGGTLSITKATVTVVAEDKTKIYGGINPELTFQYTAGFKNDDASLDITTDPTINTEATSASNVDNYDIVLSEGQDENYDFAFTSGALTINKAVLAAKANDSERPYGNQNSFSIAYLGFKNNDDASALTDQPSTVTTADEKTSPGVFDILLEGGIDNNYEYNLNNSSANLTIVKRSIDVIPRDISRLYGNDNPDIRNEYDYSDLVNTDTRDSINVPPIATTTADKFSVVTDYEIVLGQASDNNYDLVLSIGTLTVKKSPINIFVLSKNREYGIANPEFNFSYDTLAFKNSDGPDVIDTHPTPGINETLINELTSVGSYTIGFLDVGDDENYELIPNNNILEVTKAPLEITALDTARCENESNPTAFEKVAVGLRNGETLEDIGVTCTTDADADSPPGIYDITISRVNPDNYEVVNYDDGLMQIYANTSISQQPADTTGCHRSTVMFSVEAESEQPQLFYQWFMRTDEVSSWQLLSNDGTYEGVETSDLIVNNLNPDMDGHQFQVDISATYCSAITSEVATLEVLDTPPFAFIKKKSNDILINTDPDRARYQWGIGNETLPNDTTQFLHVPGGLPTDLSEYWSIAYNANGCWTQSYFGQVPDPIQTPPEDFDLFVSPNPNFTNDLSISFTDSSRGSVEVLLRRQDGSVVITYPLMQKDEDDFEEVLNLSNVTTSGVYLLHLSSPSGIKKGRPIIIVR